MSQKVTSIAAQLGALGGKATLKKRGKKWMWSLSRKAVAARRKKAARQRS